MRSCRKQLSRHVSRITQNQPLILFQSGQVVMQLTSVTIFVYSTVYLQSLHGICSKWGQLLNSIILEPLTVQMSWYASCKFSKMHDHFLENSQMINVREFWTFNACAVFILFTLLWLLWLPFVTIVSSFICHCYCQMLTILIILFLFSRKNQIKQEVSPNRKQSGNGTKSKWSFLQRKQGLLR